MACAAGHEVGVTSYAPTSGGHISSHLKRRVAIAKCSKSPHMIAKTNHQESARFALSRRDTPSSFMAN
jgi:hypothetical protein